MRYPEKRKTIMARSIALGHCVCNPKKSCPCDVFIEQDLCPCAGERPEPLKGKVELTKHVKKAGCASKIGRADLEAVLKGLPVYPDPNVIVGVAAGDDAGIYRIDGGLDLVQTVDVFSPVVDDPYLFGQICAANSVGDIYAMGGRPICALSIIGFPIEELPREVMTDILRGGLEKMREAGVSVIGGHSINDEEIKAGFAVTGLVRSSEVVPDSGAVPGDQLVLTKPIGTGVVSFADQIGLASEEGRRLIGESMSTLNKDAAELMVEFGAHACTDVTGFGLLGHLSEMLEHSGVSARIDAGAVPIFAEALGGVRNGIIPGAIERNKESFAAGVVTIGGGDGAILDLLFDAQTSGGMLVALPKERVESYVESMRRKGHAAVSWIGEIIPTGQYYVEVVLNEPKNATGTYRAQANVRKKEELCCDDPTRPDTCCSESVDTNLGCCGTPSDQRSSISETNRRKSEAPAMESTNTKSTDAFLNMMKATSEGGVVDARTKRLLAVALSISQKCEPCLLIHARKALSEGISREEIDEVAWMAVSFTGCTGRTFYLETMKKIGDS